jgi:hypothetical protein
MRRRGQRIRNCAKDWTAPKTCSQIGYGLIHLFMSQMERAHGQGNGWVF